MAPVTANTGKSDSTGEIVIGAVDIGGTKIAVGMVDDSGKVLSRLESPTDAPGGYANGLTRIVDMLRRTSQDAGAEISGIGIGSTEWCIRAVARSVMLIYCRDGREIILCKTWRANSR